MSHGYGAIQIYYYYYYYYIINNNNWTEWSSIRGANTPLISKSDECQVQGRFEIMNTILLPGLYDMRSNY